MKKWQMGICVTCAAVLAGMGLFSSSAQAAGNARPEVNSVRGQVAIFDVKPLDPTCVSQQPLLDNLLAAVETANREQARRVREAAVTRLQQGVLIIELPGREAAPAEAPLFVTAAGE